MKLILHNYTRCPFCIRARIILHLKGFEYEVVEEPLRKWTRWMQEWSSASHERARIPVLRYFENDLEGKEVEVILPESNDIDLFLDMVFGDPEYTPEHDRRGYTEMKTWWDWCDTELKPMIDLYKYGKNLEWNREANIIHEKALSEHIQKIEDHFKDHEYLVEERLTLADIAVIPFVRQIMRTRNGEFDMSRFPKTLSWANTILETDWFKNEIMKKRPLAEVGVLKNLD